MRLKGLTTKGELASFYNLLAADTNGGLRTGTTGTTMQMFRVAFLVSIGFFVGQDALANGLSENRSWQFLTSTDRANNAIVRDMIERKQGGYYDANDTIINNTYETTIQGDQINCNVAPNAVGSQSAGAMDSVTSSPDVSPGSDIHLNAAGNESANVADGDQAAVDSDQTNSGSQSASASDLSASAGAVDASGGATSQVLNNTQQNSGNQQASVTGSQGCSFIGAESGSTLN